MGTKKYVVREGFNYRVRDDKGNEKVFSEGDTLTLDEEVGSAAHQLELANEKDREAALAAEEAAKAAAPAAQPGAFNPDALAQAITAGLVQAMTQMQGGGAATGQPGAGS